MEYTLVTTDTFDEWILNLKDQAIKRRLFARLTPIENQGHFGKWSPLGEEAGLELRELKFFFGAGYRIYFTVRENEVVLLLCGGDKSSQSKDILKARHLLRNLE